MPRGNGGIIGPANIPTASSAKGVWSLMEQMIAKSQGIWPSVADPYFEYTTLLLPGNGTNGAQNNTFLDGSTNNFTITRNGNTTQGTFSPFSQTGWSGSFNTSTTYLTVTDTSNLRFGSSNFTIEAFVYRAASGATQTIASKGASTPTGWVFQISSADKLVFTDTSTSITGATSLAANTWYYVAVVRAGTGSNQTTLYVNAVSDATGTSATTFSQTDNMKIGADRSNTNFANGYISNLRLSNTNRTISSTPTSALAADSNTIFLGLYNNRFQYTDSTAAFTNMTVTGTPSVQAFSPFNPTSSWSAATNGGSGYFDGNGDYLSVADNAAFTMGTGDFTVEYWVYWNGTSSTFRAYGQVDSGGSLASISIRGGTDASNKVINGAFSGTTDYLCTSTASLVANTWNHIAFVRDGTTLRQYINGGQDGTASISTASVNDSSNQFAIGRAGEFNGNYFGGYISSFRLLKGTCLYPSGTAFTPPTAPLTAITNTSLLLNYTNAGIYDATSKNDLETVGNAQISTTQSKFGGSSMAFDGTGDYLIAPASTLQAFLTGDFTVEFWVRFNSLFSNQAVMGTASGFQTGGYQWIQVVSASTLTFRMELTTGAINVSTGTLTTNTWYHIAATRSGSTVRVFVDGVLANSTTTSGSISDSTGNQVVVGNTKELQAGRMFNGYLQDVRVTKGYARYTANFTPPTAAFPTL